MSVRVDLGGRRIIKKKKSGDGSHNGDDGDVASEARSFSEEHSVRSSSHKIASLVSILAVELSSDDSIHNLSDRELGALSELESLFELVLHDELTEIGHELTAALGALNHNVGNTFQGETEADDKHDQDDPHELVTIRFRAEGLKQFRH